MKRKPAKLHAVKRHALKARKRTSKEVHSPTLGENIRRARTKANLTQLALAHAIGYSGDDAGASVSRWENDEQTPRLDALHRIAAALGVPVCSLLAT